MKLSVNTCQHVILSTWAFQGTKVQGQCLNQRISVKSVSSVNGTLVFSERYRAWSLLSRLHVLGLAYAV